MKMTSACNVGGGGGRSMAVAAFDGGSNVLQIGDLNAKMAIDASGVAGVSI